MITLMQERVQWKGENMCVCICMCVCERESWTINIAESQRIDALELHCWRRLFDSPLDCKKIKPVNPKGNQH